MQITKTNKWTNQYFLLSDLTGKIILELYKKNSLEEHSGGSGSI